MLIVCESSLQETKGLKLNDGCGYIFMGVALTSIPGHTSVIATSPVKLLKVKCLPSSKRPLKNNHTFKLITFNNHTL